MDALSTLFDTAKKSGHVEGNLLGFFQVLIGRTISKDKVEITRGLTWRELANWLKKVRWDPDVVRELGLEPKDLPPRDRQRFWYSAIAHAKVDSKEATEAGDRFAAALRKLGYDVSAAP